MHTRRPDARCKLIRALQFYCTSFVFDLLSPSSLPAIIIWFLPYTLLSSALFDFTLMPQEVASVTTWHCKGHDQHFLAHYFPSDCGAVKVAALI